MCVLKGKDKPRGFGRGLAAEKIIGLFLVNCFNLKSCQKHSCCRPQIVDMGFKIKNVYQLNSLQDCAGRVRIMSTFWSSGEVRSYSFSRISYICLYRH